MHYKFLPSCKTTQEEIKTLLNEDSKKDYLVATAEQTQGRGRRGHEWEFYENSLAFSFSLTPSLPITLHPLLVGVRICDFFGENFEVELTLKWPNDVMTTQGQKCGGIICEVYGPENIIVGVGLNFSPNQYGFIQGMNITDQFQKDIPQKIYEYILNAPPLTEVQCREKWQNYCLHLNRGVRIEKALGIFRGVGKHGQAILSTEQGEKEIYSGSLFIQ